MENLNYDDLTGWYYSNVDNVELNIQSLKFINMDEIKRWIDCQKFHIKSSMRPDVEIKLRQTINIVSNQDKSHH